MLYNFNRAFASCLSIEGDVKESFDATFDAFREPRRGVIAGSCTILDFRENYLFITTGYFILSRAKGIYKILKAKGSKASYLYNGTKLYVRGSSGQKLWDRPVDELADSIKKNLHFPFLANTLVSCINHSIGPEPHLLRDIVAYSPNVWDEVLELLSVPFKQSALRKNRTKIALLKHTGGILSRFSGKLPFSQALSFVMATKQVKKEQYDYLLNSYRTNKEIQQAAGPYQLLKRYYLIKYNIPISKHENDYYHKLVYREGAQLINDYLSVCMKTKQKVDLSITGLKKMNEVHTELALTLKVNKLRVHKDFTLIKAEGLELIKTPCRLIEEGVKQRHCVASYIDYINSGYSGIYSIVYNDKPYTIELVRENTLDREKNVKTCLVVRQIRGFANKAAPVGLHTYVEGLVSQTTDLASDDDDNNLPF